MNQRLCPDLQKLWDDYIEAEELHIRPEIESRLKRFIENIVCKPLPE